MPPKKELAIFIVLTGFAVIGVTTVFSTTGFFDIIGVSGAYAQNDTSTPNKFEEKLHDCNQSILTFLECIFID
ncbi:MAG TPA: hypothetical protein VE130_16815 [Nitrososphaeraceae archaeon]|jgi:hypothetical protein|nr:hypothetical protein [Nitrososphaeraceae archaeon]